MQDASPDLSQAKTKADEAIFSSRLRPAIIGLIIVIAIGAAAYAYWEHATLYPSTDNAYVQANITQVAPLVTGVVTEVDAQEFKPVKSGDVLLRIDPAGFEAALKAAEARLALVQQQAGAAAGQSAAAKTNIAQAQAAVDQARLELDSATIKAPVDGIVGQGAHPSRHAGAGRRQPFPDRRQLALVGGRQLQGNRPDAHPRRQKATVYVDIYPDHAFSGKVEAVSPVSTLRVLAAAPRECHGKLDQAHAAVPRARVADLAARRSSRCASARRHRLPSIPPSTGSTSGGH